MSLIPLKNYLAAFLEDRLSTDRRNLLKIFDWPHCHKLYRIIYATKSFNEGVDFCHLALNKLEQESNVLDKKQYEHYLMQICEYLLCFLDLGDKWEDYLNLWNEIFEKLPIMADMPKVNFDSLKISKDKMDQFSYKEKNERVQVHFLWLRSDRKKIIQRKLDKFRLGKKTGNLVHVQQDALTNQEIKDRYTKTIAEIRLCYQTL